MAYQSEQIYNDLYKISVACTRQQNGNLPFGLARHISYSHNVLIARGKQNQILEYKSISDEYVKAGDLVQVFCQVAGEKVGKRPTQEAIQMWIIMPSMYLVLAQKIDLKTLHYEDF